MTNLLILGMGYTASLIARQARARGWQVTGTGRAAELAFEDEPAVRAALARASHILSSVPPEGDTDPVLARYGDALAAPPRWLGYLSSTGVYGDTQGAWVDETAPTGSARRGARALADAAWLGLGARVFRLPGIYGPGRSALDRVRAGAAHRILMPPGQCQVFSRIHVADIASGVLAALSSNAPPGAYNLSDDAPCSQNAVIEEACRLTHAPLPPLQTLEDAGLSPMARGFYAENRRVANGKARRVLGWAPKYPTYREGLAALLPDSAISSPVIASIDPPAAREVQR